MTEKAGRRKDAAAPSVPQQPGIMADFARLLAAEIATLLKPELGRWFETLDQLVLHSAGRDRIGPEHSAVRSQRDASHSSQPNLSFIRLAEVQSMTGLPRTNIYELMSTGDFPTSVQLGPRAVGWVRSEVQQWTEERVLTRAPNLHSSSLKYSRQTERAMTRETIEGEDV